MNQITFIDIEVGSNDKKVFDIGAVKPDGSSFHSASFAGLSDYVKGTDYICGHNIINHDLKYIGDTLRDAGVNIGNAVDTLYLSPLLFPKKPYHALLKDDKLQTEELNNPLNDAKKAMDLFNDEVAAFHNLDSGLRTIYYRLLREEKEFLAFFRLMESYGMVEREDLMRKSFRAIFRRDSVPDLIMQRFAGTICSNADIDSMVRQHPVSLAYSLALIDALENDSSTRSVTPHWVLHNYPEVEQIMFRLRSSPCHTGCPYCNRNLDIYSGLKRWFGFDSFRKYDGVPLQERAVRAAIENKSLLAVFPTGGGKSLTFQLPALMAGENTSGLTVVISPLQSLMKDQVDNLERRNITEAVTINGLLDPIERAKAFERVEDGSASLLYISPESLRSKSVERLISGRKITRFVIDEAHCFSSWGQDFRVDYLYIGDFIKSIQQKKNLPESIPVSCFTATAKQKVIEDIKQYFKDKLSLDLILYTASIARPNLRYRVVPENSEESKYSTLRNLIEEHDCPAIVYVSRTKRAVNIAERLCADGFSARPFHGKMTTDEKTANQNAFMSGQVKVMVATSAFGMGVDKKDVGLVVHYEISDSLENYIQEAGRAGRDENIEADCYVLFNEEDLSKHFILLNQTKLTLKEIQQIWKAIKELAGYRRKFSNSALEIARTAGWDDGVADIETRVKTALASLEQSGYIRRGQNMPRVYATSIMAGNAQEAIDKINASSLFDDKERIQAIRIIRNLIASRSRQRTREDAESRVDYISDYLGIPRKDVIKIINILREEKILADSKDLTAYIQQGDTLNRSLHTVRSFNRVEDFLLSHISENDTVLDIKALNALAEDSGYKDVNVKRINIILNFWAIKGWIKKKNSGFSGSHFNVRCLVPTGKLENRIKTKQALADFIAGYLFDKVKAAGTENPMKEVSFVEFSVLELKKAYEAQNLFSSGPVSDDVEDALFYMSRIGTIRIEGGFLVIYNALSIERLETDNKKRYKLEDYQGLANFYKNKMQQIHIVGEYARKMISDYKEALQFVEDYFQMNYPFFLTRYFRGRTEEISQNITPGKFRQLFGTLSAAQLNIIKDKDARYIVVAAGPGSGKTRVLVHKLASLLLMEDVKHEQLLMLTFSRAAATEFKKRLYELIGNAAAFVEIKTFHSYCFDLLGKIGSLDKSADIVSEAVNKIKRNEVDPSRITKSVLVIDEAQDMDKNEFELVRSLMLHNEEMRVIAVGDDDQNIYEFRGSSPVYMEKFMKIDGASKYELLENFRSRRNLVEFANNFACTIQHRLKSMPVTPVRTENGNLEIVHYTSGNLEIPLVARIIETKLSGTVAVLTRTNEEALQIAGMLQHNSIRSKLIQGNDGFSLSNVNEIRFFMDSLDLHGQSAVIADDVWQKAKHDLNSMFYRSNMLELCNNMIKAYESISPRIKYKSDFEAFVNESSMEDFISSDTGTVLVSTIHKVKGKEFDNVFLMLDGFSCHDDETRRQLYVALTRAKENLYIHENTSFLWRMSAAGLLRYENNLQYGTSSDINILLAYHDIWLDSCIRNQGAITGLVSGDHLIVSGYDVYNEKRNKVLAFSKSFIGKYNNILSKGYRPVEATVNIVLYWKPADKDKEFKIVFPELHLKKE